MVSFRSFYVSCFYIISALIFVLGGGIQFLFGFSNTFLTFFLVLFIYAIYAVYAIHKQKVVFNKVVLGAFIYGAVIVLTALFRGSGIIVTLTYLIFPLLPLAIYLFSYINYKENYLTKNKIFNLFFYISLIQLPVLVFQVYFYDFFIQFNNSGQRIAWYDFMFGTFFVKSDHSLGIFILIIVSVLLFADKSYKKAVRFPKAAIIYLGLTLFLTQSNISKVLFVILICGSILGPLYKKYKGSLKFKVVTALLIGLLFSSGYYFKEKQFVQRKLGGTVERQFSLESAEKFYEDGTAKRFQIIIVAAKKLKTKWIGEGPYSYFDIRTGEFKQTRHFTQLIWTYFDLGIIGLVAVFLYILRLVFFLEIDKGIPFIIFLGIFLIYAVYTTILSDITILFSIFSVFNKRLNTTRDLGT